jgi:dynein heavy chain
MEGEDDVYEQNPNYYHCPIYKTSTRSGVLSTTGQSTNHILNVCLPINTKEFDAEHWTLRGAAMLTMIDD